jgi:hypothetical protein
MTCLKCAERVAQLEQAVKAGLNWDEFVATISVSEPKTDISTPTYQSAQVCICETRDGTKGPPIPDCPAHPEHDVPRTQDHPLGRGRDDALSRHVSTQAYQAEEVDVSKMSPQERAAWSCEARACHGCSACESSNEGGKDG